MRFVIYPYKVSSESAHRLKDAFKEAGHNSIIVYPDRNYQCKEGELVIGWGCSRHPTWENTIHRAWDFLNPWTAVERSINKKAAFKAFKSVHCNTPEFVELQLDALRWLEEGHTVLGRKQLRGMKGKGIVVMHNPADFQECKGYTKFIPNTKEYRIYTLNGQVIDVLQKRRKQGTADPGYVRTEENGWVFCRENVDPPIGVGIQALKATDALGLDFAGVDVLWSRSEHKAYVLETNTCPDIFGSGLPIFRDAFINLAKECA